MGCFTSKEKKLIKQESNQDHSHLPVDPLIEYIGPIWLVFSTPHDSSLYLDADGDVAHEFFIEKNDGRLVPDNDVIKR